MKLLSVSARTDTGSKSVHASQGRIRFMLSNRSELFFCESDGLGRDYMQYLVI